MIAPTSNVSPTTRRSPAANQLIRQPLKSDQTGRFFNFIYLSPLLFKFTFSIINSYGEGIKPTPKSKSTKPLGNLIMFIPDFVKIALPCVGVFLAAVIFLHRGRVFTNQPSAEWFTAFLFFAYGLIELAASSLYIFTFFAFVFSIAVIASKGKFYKDKIESEVYFSMMFFLLSAISLVHNIDSIYLS